MVTQWPLTNCTLEVTKIVFPTSILLWSQSAHVQSAVVTILLCWTNNRRIDVSLSKGVHKVTHSDPTHPGGGISWLLCVRNYHPLLLIWRQTAKCSYGNWQARIIKTTSSPIPKNNLSIIITIYFVLCYKSRYLHDGKIYGQALQI